MVKVVCNWNFTPNGNAIKEGARLTVTAKGASHISGAIYKNGLPVLPIFAQGDTATVLVKRKGMNLKGLALLKIRGFDTKDRGFGIDDVFIIE